jgi:hypothetical protein
MWNTKRHKSQTAIVELLKSCGDGGRTNSKAVTITRKETTVTEIVLPELQISTPNHGNEVDPMSAVTGHHRSPLSSPYRTIPMFSGVLH